METVEETIDLIKKTLSVMKDSDILEPSLDIREGEEDLHLEVPFELRRLYSLYQGFWRECLILSIKGREEETWEPESYSAVLRELFFYKLRQIYSLWGIGIGLRKGFKIVKLSSEKRPPSPIFE